MSGFHTMLMYGAKDSSRRMISEMGGELATSLSLLETTQNELSKKIKLLSDSERIYKDLEGYAENLEDD